MSSSVLSGNLASISSLKSNGAALFVETQFSDGLSMFIDSC